MATDRAECFTLLFPERVPGSIINLLSLPSKKRKEKLFKIHK
jgi:hypothetical protein